jgi:DNA-binding LacI/PurR family transcriptional regulator
MRLQLKKESKITLTEQIVRQMRKMIKKNELPGGSRLPASMQLATELGVAYKTVESAIAQLAGEGYVERYRRKGSFVCKADDNDTPNKVLRICMLLWTKDREDFPYVGNIIKGIKCTEANIELSIKGIDEYEATGEDWLNALKRDSVKYDGLLIDKEGFMTYELLDFIQFSNVPRVMLNSPVYELLESEYCIMPNYVGGAYQLTELLVESGHQQIGFLQRYSTEPTHRLRSDMEKYNGIKSSLMRHKLPIDKQLCMGGMYNSVSKVHEAIKTMLKLDKPPTALICADDIIAFNVISACEQLGLKVPDDISVCGFYNFDIRTVRHPFLTTINLRSELMGIRALNNLLTRINGGKVENGMKIFSVSLLKGESVASPRIKKLELTTGDNRNEI